MFTTPGGRSVSCMSSAKRIVLSEASSAGLSTTVLPQASALAIFMAAISNGMFHAMICPHTPIGSRSVYESTDGSEGRVRPNILVGQPA